MGCIWFDVCWCSVAVWLWWCGIRMQSEYFMGCIWFDVCWCSVAVWLWWCGIRMQSEALLQTAYGYHTTIAILQQNTNTHRTRYSP